MPDLPSVSVVMPARNAAATIAAAVSGVAAQDYPGLELIVAAAPSTDATRRILDGLAADHPAVRIVANDAGTTPAGLNAALAAARGEVIVRCDAHSILPTGYVRAAVAALERTGADVVGGVQDPKGDAPVARWIAAAMRSGLGSGGAAYRTGHRPGPTDTVYLGVFRRSAIDRVGGFDERLERNQDYEMNLRIRDSGGVVWLDPALRVEYRPRRSIGALWRQYLSYGRWKRRVVRLHPASTRLRQLAAPVLLVVLAASLVLGATGRTAALLVPLAYGALLVGASIATAIRRRRLAPLMMWLPLVTMHVAWGTGFLMGPPRRSSQAARAA